MNLKSLNIEKFIKMEFICYLEIIICNFKKDYFLFKILYSS